MALKVDQYSSGRRESDLAILFLYPWGGERHNNRDTLRKLAVITGGLVIGAQTPGTGRMYINRATRRRLRYGRLGNLAADYAGEVKEFLDKSGQPRRLLVAQSGRVALGARMQLSEHRPFTHVALRDGVNLCAPESVREGYGRLTAQPSRGEHDPGYPEEPKSRLHRLQDFHARWHGRVEIVTQGSLLCSPESMEAVEELATDVKTQLFHMTFAHGITGTLEQQNDFRDRLGAARWRARVMLSPEENNNAAPIEAIVQPGNHADLQNLFILHDHVNAALGVSRQSPQIQG